MSSKPLTNILEDCLSVEVFSTLHLMFFSHISHQTSSLNLVFFLHKQNRPQLAPLVPKPAFSGPPDVPLLKRKQITSVLRTVTFQLLLCRLASDRVFYSTKLS